MPVGIDTGGMDELYQRAQKGLLDYLTPYVSGLYQNPEEARGDLGKTLGLLGIGGSGREAMAGGLLGMGAMPMTVRPTMVPMTKPELGIPGLKGIWESINQQPQVMTYPKLNRMPGLLEEKKEIFSGVSQPNPKAGELAAAYNTGAINEVGKIEDIYQGIINRNEAGKSIYDDIFDRQVQLRRDLMKQPEYKIDKQSVSTGRSNIKTEGEITPLDCSRGCLGFCPECYAAFGKSGMRSHAFPKEVDWVGHVSKSKEGNIYRVGEMGEPGFNPETWKQYEPTYRQMMESGQKISPEDIYQLAEPSYDWSYFNQQLEKTGLSSQKGTDKTYVITKLQSLNNFDPSLIKNMQVSIDPLIPDHFFRALKNVEALKAVHPDYNVMLRIRSIATGNDEINSLQKIAVDFANKHNIPVLETRLRFKSRQGAEQAEVLPEYVWAGGQYVHQSYYPSIYPKLSGASKVSGTTKVRTFQAHTPEGPKETGVYLTSDEGKGGSWQVWSEGKMVAHLPEEQAKQLGQELADAHSGGISPTKMTVWQINRDESPLSQFGLDPKLTHVCNEFNVSGAACKECGSCKSFVDVEKMRAQ